jgi:peptidoglycan/xylan/chitin deacetylase (PgdA/CDA1 family)
MTGAICKCGNLLFLQCDVSTSELLLSHQPDENGSIMRDRLKQMLLQGTYSLGAHRLIAQTLGGLGTILMLHSVVRNKEDSPSPYLTVTAAFLEHVIIHLRELNTDFIPIAELKDRLSGKTPRGNRFAVITFDDGYKDNMTLGLAVLRKHGVPAIIYVPSGAPDRTMDVWFLRLERIVQDFDSLPLNMLGIPESLDLRGAAAKTAAYERLTGLSRQDMTAMRAFVNELLPPSHLSDAQLMDQKFLSWDELRTLTADPLITIGAHTVSHPALSELCENEAFSEIMRGKERLEAELAQPVKHFAYPYGSALQCGEREFALAAGAGFETAVTTRYGNIYPQHRDHLFALPRMTLGGPVESMADTVLDVSGSRVALSKRCFKPVVTV